MQVFLNNKMIYQFGEPGNDKLIGWNQNLVELPFCKKGDQLTLRIKTAEETVNVLKNIRLSSSGNIITKVFYNSAISLFFSVLFFFTGLTILIIYFGVFKSKLLLGIAAFITSISFLFVANTLFLQLLIKAPALYYRMDYISLMLTTTSGFFAIAQIIDTKYKKVLNIIWQAHFAFFIVNLPILNFTSITFPDVLPFFMSFLVISMIVCFIAMVLSTRSGSYESKLLFFGMSSFFFFAIIEIILFFEEGLYTGFGFSVRVLHFGALCFVITLLWIVVRDYLNTNRQKELAYQKVIDATRRESETRHQYAAKLLESQENERKRIASELHDAVGQDLLVIKNTALLGLSNKDLEVNRERYLNQISEITSKSIEDIRQISRNLHPFQIDKLGLTKALKSIVDFVQDNSEIKFISKIDDLGRVFSKEKAIHIYRILQEIINNIIKHSGASETDIRAQIIKHKFCLTVSDNGKGIPEDVNGNIPKTNFGFGLTGLLERAKLIGGKVEIKPGKKCGLIITVTVPLPTE
jgi:signal transduction histidine kinase